jgi:molybdopterin-containing oxidoreductase family membrane subunit
MEVTGMTNQKSLKWSFYGWIAVVIAGIGIGIWGAVTLLSQGHATAGTSDQIPWGIFVPGYLFFVAASAGCVIVTLGYVLGIKRFALIMKRAVFLAVATLIAGGILIILDLGSPQEALSFLASPNLQSPMWWMSIFYPLFLILLIVQFYSIQRGGSKKVKAVTVLTALVAIIEHSMLGALFGWASVRTYFGGALSPVYFVLISIVIGTALLLFLTILQYRLTGKEMNQELQGLVMDLGKFLGLLVGITILFTIWKDLTGFLSTVGTTSLAYEHIFSLWWYWVIVVLMGLIIPVILLYNPRTRNLNGIIVSSILVLIGMFAARFEFTIGGQIAPVLENLQHLEYPLSSYSATFVEVAVMIFSVAVAALLYTIGIKTLALEKAPQHD